jgi:hypothetical protein
MPNDSGPPSKKVRISSVDELKTAHLSVAEKVKALKQVGDEAKTGMETFISSHGIELVGDWLTLAVQTQETGLILSCLGLLEKLPITVETLQSTKIGKLVNEQMKNCSNQVAVERARKLINNWKSVVNGNTTVVVAKATPPVVTSKVEEAINLVEDSPLHSPVGEDEGDNSTVSALANLLDVLPDLDSLLAAAEETTNTKKKRVVWKPDSDLVQMVEFAITGTCEELRRTIDETHGGLNSLHPHGEDTADSLQRFRETRKRERAMGGRGLQQHVVYADEDDIEATIPFRFPPRSSVTNSEAIHNVKKLKSYERQDLADIHGPRPEVVYQTDDEVPDTPSDPSSSSKFFTSINTTTNTIDVFPSGVKDAYEAEKANEEARKIAAETPVRVANFEDEFVKLDSKIQSAILESDDLVRIFTQDPMLMRDITIEKIRQVLSTASTVVHSQSASPTSVNRPHPGPPQQLLDDKRTWGVATIRSSVRNQVMNSFQQPPVPQHGFPAHGFPPQRPVYPKQPPPHWPPHQGPPQPPPIYGHPKAPPGYPPYQAHHPYPPRGPPPRR